MARLKWLRWGVVYLAAVPVFAGLYTNLGPNSLHDANSTLERSVALDAGALISALSRAVNERVGHATRWRANDARNQLSGPVRVSKLHKPENGSCLFVLEGKYVAVRRSSVGVGYFVVPVEATLESSIGTQKPGQERLVRVRRSDG